MKTILTFGVFDMLHIGHILLFQHIKEQSPDCNLVVAIQTDNAVLKYKPQAKLIYSASERAYMVGSVRYVDSVCFYDDVDLSIQSIPFDILILGPDQQHAGFQRAMAYCLEHGKEIRTIPRTEGISSSLLREYKKI